ncbi:hypothetical protein [Pseudomonas sp. R37(2017)]|uniref:hypothetical protein n=1 Tax=Pseudomonas sp. R37(2017) TaxID=1981685 RepID=UPI00117A21D6|nr:hypothetical protein [Pseudomonas sp. R37(2017)]
MDAIEYWGDARVMEDYIARTRPTLFLLLLINDLGGFDKGWNAFAVAKSIRHESGIKAEGDQSLAQP